LMASLPLRVTALEATIAAEALARTVELRIVTIGWSELEVGGRGGKKLQRPSRLYS
jgi:hypothetical protein